MTGCDASDFFLFWFNEDKLSYASRYVTEPQREYAPLSRLQGRQQALIDMSTETRTHSPPEFADATLYRLGYNQERIDFHARPKL